MNNPVVDTMFQAALNTLINSYKAVIEASTISQERGRIKEQAELAHKRLLGRFVGTEHYFDILKYVDELRGVISGEIYELQGNYCEGENTGAS